MQASPQVAKGRHAGIPLRNLSGIAFGGVSPRKRPIRNGNRVTSYKCGVCRRAGESVPKPMPAVRPFSGACNETAKWSFGLSWGADERSGAG